MRGGGDSGNGDILLRGGHWIEDGWGHGGGRGQKTGKKWWRPLWTAPIRWQICPIFDPSPPQRNADVLNGWSLKQNNFMKFWAFLIHISKRTWIFKKKKLVLVITWISSIWFPKFWFTVQVGKHRRYLSGKQARLDHFLCAAGLKSWNEPIISKVPVSFCIPSLIAMTFIIT